MAVIHRAFNQEAHKSECWCSVLIAFIESRTPVCKTVPTTFMLIFPPWLILLEIPSQAHPELCCHGDCKSSQVGNEG